MTPRSLATIFGLIFVAVGILGFVDNPIIGDSPDAVFHADSMHNYVHIGSGVLFLLVALGAPGFAATFMKIFGIVYLAIGIVGMINLPKGTTGEILGFLHVNSADNYLHIALGIVIFLAGFARRRTVAS